MYELTINGPGESVASIPTGPATENAETLEHVPNVKIIGRHMQCPHCEKGFRLGTYFAKHLRALHSDEDTALKVQSRRMY